ncbi:MAG: sn-glycerol-3-phosphate ABC transporter ATP-binding protein UgpC [Neomegalonema sp.]|nr:sn-glycerol-3-phosphate ABC transporter ATP-binding protein UgpC [Neomegalonema sp.]
MDHVTKEYSTSGRPAVSDVSLAIAEGEFIVLVGPSGCGKSTLLRMVAGLEKITDGEVRIGDRRVNEVDPADRDIAMVFQNYALYPHMTVRKNMGYGLKNRRLPKAEIEKRVAEAASILQLDEYLDRRPRELSGGQRQRVAMGRAIVREPACFLFDEPLSNLDAKLRVEMRGEIKQLQRRLGTTSIYVTHDQLEAMTLADRLVVLNKGEVEQIGAPLDVYRSPASTFVASFIGSPAMSLLNAASDGSALRIGDVVVASGAGLAAGPVTLGVRAEDFILAPTSGGFAMQVSYVEELGAGRLVHGAVQGQMLTLSISADHPMTDELIIAIDPARLHLFDASSGKRITPRRETAEA